MWRILVTLLGAFGLACVACGCDLGGGGPNAIGVGFDGCSSQLWKSVASHDSRLLDGTNISFSAQLKWADCTSARIFEENLY
ncbi:hypothetical protein V8F33_000178 [Rhypophila sp. PSN 637]